MSTFKCTDSQYNGLYEAIDKSRQDEIKIEVEAVVNLILDHEMLLEELKHFMSNQKIFIQEIKQAIQSLRKGAKKVKINREALFALLNEHAELHNETRMETAGC